MPSLHLAHCVILLLWTGSINAKANCTAPWENLFGDSCHLLTKEVETWNEAKISCLSKGSHLFVIDSDLKQREFEKWSSSYKKLVPSQHNFWAGGTDFGSEQDWYWDHTRRPFVYTHWQHGYPKKTYRNNCLLIGNIFHNFWRDISCDIIAYYICEKSS